MFVSASIPKLPPRLARWGPLFAAAEIAYGVPCELLAAVCDRESLGGDALRPAGPGGVGDGGHGHGIMQIDDRSHGGFCGAKDDTGAPLWADPAMSIMYGARLLARLAKASSADWDIAIAAYNCGLRRAKQVLSALPQGVGEVEKIAALDRMTTGGNYVSDVRRRCQSFSRNDEGNA